MPQTIKYADLAKDPAWPIIQQAISFPYTHTKKCDPKTRTGEISVAAIYNLSAWSSWKSSSLGRVEKAQADTINQFDLVALVNLNRGRRSNMPALFPDNFLALPSGAPALEQTNA